MRQPSNLSGVVLDSLKPRVSCQDVSFPKGFGMKNKAKPWIGSVCYYLKCCIGTKFSKMRSKGRNSWLGIWLCKKRGPLFCLKLLDVIRHGET